MRRQRRNTLMFLVGGIFVTSWSHVAAGQQVTIETIDHYFENRLVQFRDAIDSEGCTAVIEGRVVAVRAEPYSQWSKVGGLQWHVGRVIEIEVHRSWKSKLVGRITVGTHGGILEEAIHDPASGIPLGCGSSDDIHVANGDEVILAVTVNNPLRARALWTFHGRRGLVSVNRTCESFRNETERAAFSPEALQYLENRKERFVAQVYSALAGYAEFWADGGAQ